MIVALAAAVGYLTGRLCWVALQPTFLLPVFQRQNFRGRPVATAGGLVLPLAVLLVEGVRVVAGTAGAGAAGGLTPGRTAVLIGVVGLGLLGAFDDLAGSSDTRGFRGHVVRLAHGELTSGGVKLLGGAAVALIVVAPQADDDVSRLIMDGALVALSANLANLLDRAPGRALKAAGAGVVALVVATAATTILAPVAVVVGAAMALLAPDLREHLMLGDAGANALGGAVGLAVVLACAPSTRTGVLIAVVALNLASELVSFSQVIDRWPPLRAADRWGRRG